MKKIRLFLVAVAAMLGCNVYAQSWTADEVKEGVYLLYNIGSGQYLTRGNGWDTQGSISRCDGDAMYVQLIADGSNYLIRSGVNGSSYGIEAHNATDIYTDQSRSKNSSWTFTKVGDNEYGPIYTIISADNHIAGSGKVMAANPNNTKLVYGDSSSDYAKWQLRSTGAQTRTLAGMEGVEVTKPMDVTGLINNNHFYRSDFSSPTAGRFWTMQASNQNLGGGRYWNRCAESWRSAFTLSQEISGLPSGMYRLQAQAALTEYTVTGNDLPVIYANDQTSPFKAMAEGEGSMDKMSEQFTAGKYEVEPIYVKVTDGKLTVGAKGTRTDTWCIWDNFRLTYYGPDATVDQAIKSSAYVALGEALEKAKAINTTAPTKVLSDAIATAEPVWSFDSSLDALTEAEAALTTVINQYADLYPAVELANKVIAYVEEADAFVNVYAEAIAAAKEAVYNATTAQAAKDAAYNCYDKYFLPYDGAIVNDEPTANLDGWTKVSESNEGNCNHVFRSDLGVAEYWRYNFEFNQEVELPAGTYIIENVAYARDGATNVALYVDGKAVNLVQVTSGVSNSVDQASAYFDADRENGMNRIVFNLPADGKVKIGLKNSNNLSANDGWTIWRSFKLQVVPASVYPSLLAQAKALYNDGDTRMEGDVQAVLLDDIQTYGNVDLTNTEELAEAIDVLRDIIEKAKASIALYEEIKAAIDYVQTIATSEADDYLPTLMIKYMAGQYKAPAEVFADYQKVEGQTLINAESTQTQIDKDGQADFTSMLINPSFETGDMTGWTAPNAGADCGVKKADDPTYEFEGSDGDYVFNNWANWITTLDLTQTIKGLPNGNYTLTGVVAGYGDEAPITIKVNNQTVVIAPKADDVNAEIKKGYPFSINLKVTTGELVITVKNDGKGYTFFKADDFKLMYAPLTELVLNNAGWEEFYLHSDEADDGLYGIGIGSSYVVNDESPYDLSEGVICKYYGTDVVNREVFNCGFRADATIEDEDGNVFSFKTVGDKYTNELHIGAGFPFDPDKDYTITIHSLVYYNFDQFCDEIYEMWEAGKESHMIPDPADPSWEWDEEGNPTGKGSSYIPDPTWTLAKCDTLWSQQLYESVVYPWGGPMLIFDYCDPLPLYVDTWYDDMPFFFVRTYEEVPISPWRLRAQDFHAYDAAGNDWTEEFLARYDGTATGVNKLDTQNGKQTIYNVAGQRVAKTKKGLYIVNGRKVAVK